MSNLIPCATGSSLEGDARVLAFEHQGSEDSGHVTHHPSLIPAKRSASGTSVGT